MITQNVGSWKRMAAFVLLFLSLGGTIRAGEETLFDYAEFLFGKGDYYNTVTECKRYQALYPKGQYYRKSVVLMGVSYYRGKNISVAAVIMEKCATSFQGSDEGEEALFFLTGIRIMGKMPLLALREISLYKLDYPQGKNRERVDLNRCYALALSYDLNLALQQVENFKEKYSKNVLLSDAENLEKMIRAEIQRPRKSVAVAFMGSLVIPGFGYFYTEHYLLGTLSLLSNSLVIFLIYNAVVHSNIFQMVFFSLIEASLYQYSLYGAIRSVHEYNSHESFQRHVTVRFGESF